MESAEQNFNATLMGIFTPSEVAEIEESQRKFEKLINNQRRNRIAEQKKAVKDAKQSASLFIDKLEDQPRKITLNFLQ